MTPPNKCLAYFVNKISLLKSADGLREKEMKICIPRALVVIAVMASLSVAQQEQTANRAAPAIAKTQSSHSMVTPESIKWSASGSGQWFAVISGSPNTEGSPFVIRIKLADGVKVAPHWHPVDEHITVITGAFYMGMGEKFNESTAKEMTAGSYAFMPKEMRHFAWTKGETIVQIHGVGPFKTYWVESDKERNKN
jgi:anti-sigma factor ChrR (cupin superfamily)